MKKAYLITAYHQPEHLKRLIASLDSSETAFYIHVDANSELRSFHNLVGNHSNITFLQNRARISWMGFSQVRSIILLLTEAVKCGFDYCTLLSGSDYPIKSKEYILDYFASAREEFLVHWKLQDRPSWMAKVKYYYPIDLIPIHGHSKGTERSYWRRLFWGRFFMYCHYFPARKFVEGFMPYGGSDWWSLSYDCAQFILKVISDRTDLTRFFRYTHCPSELFFHTIVMNSQYASRVRCFSEYCKWSMLTSAESKAAENCMLQEHAFNLRYIDWSGGSDGLRPRPAILNEQDFNELLKSRCLFARKFECGHSEHLLDMIDREILGIGA